MNKSDFEKKLLIKLIKKDLKLALTSEDINKADIIKILNYYIKKTEALSE